MNIKIRKETKTDHETINQLVKTAFETANVSGGEEYDMVVNMRNTPKYIPELSLIAENNGVIIGYIMLSKTTVSTDRGEFTGLLLGPVCSILEFRNQGVGAELIRKAISKAKEMGYTAIFLAGDRNYYSRFGFVPASRYNIKCQHEVPAELLDNIMALELIPSTLDGVGGIVQL